MLSFPILFISSTRIVTKHTKKYKKKKIYFPFKFCVFVLCFFFHFYLPTIIRRQRRDFWIPYLTFSSPQQTIEACSFPLSKCIGFSFSFSLCCALKIFIFNLTLCKILLSLWKFSINEMKDMKICCIGDSECILNSTFLSTCITWWIHTKITSTLFERENLCLIYIISCWNIQ